MCNLCDPAESETGGRERGRLKFQALQLRELSFQIERLASGKIEPHSIDASRIGEGARTQAIALLKEWG